MYSNPPMDYPYLTPSSHQWSIPPTYPTNPSFITPTTPSFPSFPWELFSPYYTNTHVPTPSPILYPNHGYSPHPPNPNSYSSYSSSPHSYYYHNYHQQLEPTNTSSIISHQYQTYSRNRRDFDKYLQISHSSFKKRSKKKSQNSFQLVPTNLFAFPLQTKTLVSPFSLNIRTNHIHGNYFSQTLTTRSLPNDNGRFPHQPPQQISERNFVNHANRINGTTVLKPSDPFIVSPDPLWKIANKARGGAIPLSIFGEEAEFDLDEPEESNRTTKSDDVSDEASSIESSQNNLFGEINRAISLKRKEFVKQGLLKPNSAKEDIAEVIHEDLQPYEVDDIEEIERLKGLVVNSDNTPGDFTEDDDLGSDSDSLFHYDSLAVMSDLGILSASHGGSLRLWAVSSEVLMEMVGHTATFYSIDSYASGLIVSGSEDCFAKIWKYGVCVQSIEHPGCVWDTKFMENGDNGGAYAWNMAEHKWDKIGEVVDGPEGSSRPLFDSDQYDSVFNVDIRDGMPIRKLTYNQSNSAYSVADKWLLKEGLHLSFREQVEQFVLHNNGQKVTTFDASFHDSYTDSNAYVPGHHSRATDIPTKHKFKHIPMKGMLALDTAQFDGILKKVVEFNNALLSDQEKQKLSSAELDVSRLDGIDNTLKDTSHYHASKFADSDIALLLKMLSSWPITMLFPVIDIIRMLVLHPEGAVALHIMHLEFLQTLYVFYYHFINIRGVFLFIVWDPGKISVATKRAGIQTFCREHDRFWILSTHPEMNLLEAGHDCSMIFFKLERERLAFAVSGDSLFETKDHFLRFYEFSTQRETQVLTFRRCGSLSLNQSPKTLSHSPTENAILLCSDVDGGIPAKFVIIDDGWQSVSMDINGVAACDMKSILGLFFTDDVPSLSSKLLQPFGNNKHAF